MALFSSTSDFKKYTSIDVNTDFNTIKPFIEQAEELFLKDLLGADFYTEFNTAFQASIATPTPTPLSADNIALLPYIQKPLAYYTLYYGLPQLGISFGDLGFQQNFNDRSQPAPQWKVDQFQFDCIKNGDLFADKLLEFLEANASNSKYITWFTKYNTSLTGTIVHSAAIAGKYIQINNSRRVFLKIRALITLIESRYVPKKIGNDQYNLIINNIKAGTLTDAEKALVAKLEPIIAKMALEKSLPALDITLTQDGITIYSFNNSIVQKMKPTDLQMQRLRNSLKCLDEFGYEADEQDLIQFINDNIASYPLIAASTVYTNQPTDGPVFRPDNSAESNHFAV